MFSSYITYISKFYYILLTMYIFYNKVSTILWWAGKGTSHLSAIFFTVLLSTQSTSMKANHLIKRTPSVNLKLLKLSSSWFSSERFAATAQKEKRRMSLSSKIIPSVDTSSLTCPVKPAHPPKELDQDLFH